MRRSRTGCWTEGRQEATISSASISRLPRTAGMFFLDLLGAVLVPAMVEGAVWRLLPVHSPLAVVVKEWCLDLTVAGFVGFMMYRSWHSATSRWVWALPALWFAFRAIPYAGVTHPSSVLSADESFWAHFSGGSCAARTMDCRDFFAFSVPFIRSVSYSASAWLASKILKPALNSATDSETPR